MSKVISIINQKGGSGKTTTTKALSLGLSKLGYKILAIETDPQGNLTTSLGIPNPDEHYGLADLLIECNKDKINLEKVKKIIKSPVENIDLIVGNDELDSFDISLSSFSDGLFYLDTIVSLIKNDYEYILIDCRPSFSNLTKSALICSDEIIIPTELETFSLKGSQKLLREITLIQKRYNPKLRINGLLPTKMEHNNHHKEFLEILYQLFNGNKFYAPISKSIEIQKSNQGYDFFEYAKNCKATKQYKKFIFDFLNIKYSSFEEIETQIKEFIEKQYKKNNDSKKIEYLTELERYSKYFDYLTDKKIFKKI